MTDNRYAKVFCISPNGEPFGILDRTNGLVSVYLNKDTPDTIIPALLDGRLDNSDLVWSNDVEVLGELGPVPERIGPKFETLTLTDIDGDYITVEKSEDDSGLSSYIHTSKYGVNIHEDNVPVLISAIALSVGIDPAIYNLPTE